MATVAYSSRSNEQATIRSAQLGKADALGVLYTKYRSFVHHRCLALTRDVTLAEDLTQEVFLQMCRSISTFKGNADFRTWLYRIATNAFLMHLRKNKHRLLSLEQPVSDESEEVTLGETLPSVSLHPDDYLLLSEAVSGLSSSGREILLMHDLGGYKHNEIGRILGMRDGTSKSQLYCARVKVRAIFLRRRRQRRSLRKFLATSIYPGASDLIDRNCGTHVTTITADAKNPS